LSITVFVVDQNRSRRAECVRLLKCEDAILVIGQSQRAADGIILVSKFKPNIALFDLDLALNHGRGLLSTIRRQSPRTKVILLTESFSPSRLLASFSYGALGCIRNRDIASCLIKAVRAVDVGEAWVPRSLASNILKQINLKLLRK
jgi:DNA-binding NarL/FixJ family response regulator